MIDYESLAQDAMRGVVRAVLARTAKGGLPGDHHFYISFDTQAPGVGLSKRLREKYPEEMTIVLQHRFWDLAVNEDRFEVKLTFDGIPERLVVPFAALKVFFDPSVRYGLQFEAPDLTPEMDSESIAPQDQEAEQGEAAAPAESQPAVFRAPRPVAERKTVRSARKPRAKETAETGSAETANLRTKTAPQSEEKSDEAPAAEQPAAPEPASGAQIVRLDAFRKK